MTLWGVSWRGGAFGSWTPQAMTVRRCLEESRLSAAPNFLLGTLDSPLYTRHG